ncbi:MAG: hypothetical protein KDJ52_28875 [Anaerolineae bacterium]|nr:hypothetical protein [Anaerolineae bacterium]
MKVTRPMVIAFYIIIGLTALILAATRIANGLYLNALVGVVIGGFCAYRLFVILRSG